MIDTVTISTSEYNNLIRFYDGMQDGKYCSIDAFCSTVYYKEENKVINDLEECNKDLNKKLDSFWMKQEAEFQNRSLWSFFIWKVFRVW